jgi:hypothetical protein
MVWTATLVQSVKRARRRANDSDAMGPELLQAFRMEVVFGGRPNVAGKPHR